LLDPSFRVFENDGCEASIEETEHAVSAIRMTFVVFDPWAKAILVQTHKDRWMDLVTSLADTWGFRLLNPRTWEPAPAKDFLRILGQTQACEGIIL
jgi:hypothetical protein